MRQRCAAGWRQRLLLLAVAAAPHLELASLSIAPSNACYRAALTPTMCAPALLLLLCCLSPPPGKCLSITKDLGCPSTDAFAPKRPGCIACAHDVESPYYSHVPYPPTSARPWWTCKLQN